MNKCKYEIVDRGKIVKVFPDYHNAKIYFVYHTSPRSRLFKIEGDKRIEIKNLKGELTK